MDEHVHNGVIVKLKIKTYVQIYKMVTDYWDEIAQEFDLQPISKHQLRNRIKKYLPSPSKASTVHFFKMFPELEQ